MKLYYSQNSPYARITRVMARELGLMGSIEELPSKNRKPDNPVLRHSSVGRVPTLVEEDLVITETGNVVRFLSSKAKLSDANLVDSKTWSEIMQEGQIVGFLEGLVHWVREDKREEVSRSDHFLEVERERARRCLSFIEGEARSGHLGEFPKFRFVALAVALGMMEQFALVAGWKDDFPTLAQWYQDMHKRASMVETTPA